MRPWQPEKLMNPASSGRICRVNFNPLLKIKTFKDSAIVGRSGSDFGWQPKKVLTVGKYISAEFMQILERVFQGEVILERPHMKGTSNIRT